MPTVSMGDLARTAPDDDEDGVINNIIEAVKRNYPPGWEKWKIIDYSYNALFGEELSPLLESKLRFGLPTTELVQAFHPNKKDLSERVYRHIRRQLIKWPIGRALIYSPHCLVERIHAPSYKEFMGTIRDLRADGKLTNRERTARLLSGENENSHVNGSPHSSSPRSERRSTQRSTPVPLASKRVREEEEGDAPPPKRKSLDPASGDQLMAAVLQQQSDLFNKLIEIQQEQSRKIEQLQHSLTPKSPPALNESFQSIPDSTHEEQDRSPLLSDGNHEISLDVSHESAGRSPETLSLIKTADFDFRPHTTEAESKFSKANPVLAQQGSKCQRLGTDSWKNIRYGDVQKNFQATPVFCALKPNNLLAGITPNWTSVAVLEKFDLTLGAITHGLLQQRQIFEHLYAKLPQDIKHQVGQEFLNTNSEFRKNSDALLQYVCGRRAEVLQQRRDTYKIKSKILHEVLHSIPPSETHLFTEPEFSQTVKDQGGIHKFFPFKKQYPRMPAKASQNQRPDKRSHNYKRAPAKYNYRSANPTFIGSNRKSQNFNDKSDKGVKLQNKWKGPKRA